VPRVQPLGFDVTRHVRAGGISTYFIRARNEGDGYGWRRLDANATTLIVNFQHPAERPRHRRR
jgi:hypothetical protein